MTRHKVFISYHHANDEVYKREFIRVFQNYFIDKSVHVGEYDEDLSTDYIKRLIREEKITDSSIIVVLIGSETYKRKHVDWEISAGLSCKAGGCSGLIGILLPSYYSSYENSYLKGNGYNSKTIPPRLNDNVESGYSYIYKWDSMAKVSTDGNYAVINWIDEAYNRIYSKSEKIKNSREQFTYNRA